MSKSSTSRLRQRLIEQRAEGTGTVDYDQAETLLDGEINGEHNSTILDKVCLFNRSFFDHQWTFISIFFALQRITSI
jgi:hypothetical protein